jgi:hypothetical protein
MKGTDDDYRSGGTGVAARGGHGSWGRGVRADGGAIQTFGARCRDGCGVDDNEYGCRVGFTLSELT